MKTHILYRHWDVKSGLNERTCRNTKQIRCGCASPNHRQIWQPVTSGRDNKSDFAAATTSGKSCKWNHILIWQLSSWIWINAGLQWTGTRLNYILWLLEKIRHLPHVTNSICMTMCFNLKVQLSSWLLVPFLCLAVMWLRAELKGFKLCWK